MQESIYINGKDYCFFNKYNYFITQENYASLLARLIIYQEIELTSYGDKALGVHANTLYYLNPSGKLRLLPLAKNIEEVQPLLLYTRYPTIPTTQLKERPMDNLIYIILDQHIQKAILPRIRQHAGLCHTDIPVLYAYKLLSYPITIWDTEHKFYGDFVGANKDGVFVVPPMETDAKYILWGNAKNVSGDLSC